VKIIINFTKIYPMTIRPIRPNSGLLRMILTGGIGMLGGSVEKKDIQISFAVNSSFTTNPKQKN
jgi:ABC-type sulfate transport system permease subunit